MVQFHNEGWIFDSNLDEAAQSMAWSMENRGGQKVAATVVTCYRRSASYIPK